MATDIAISVEGLSKCYRVGHQAHREEHPTLRDQIMRHARNFARKTHDMATGKTIVQGDTVEDFWALRDVNFEIPQGARVGILGRNGAGKSTLLKLLSRITEPTNGRIKIHGRVASLLEVGTGFHPELTGRENIFLNGAILGMSRTEIQRKFDEIVEFAEVERFLDTPVKRYSSGMYVRLAFGVAAHLEPEILIVDEVLAVGDIQFQKKCLGKMDDVAKTGRTVLFVSHNMAAISQLCETALVLTQGTVSFRGDAQSGISHYNRNSQQLGNPADLSKRGVRRGTGIALFERAAILNCDQHASTQFSIGEEVRIELRIRTTEIGRPVSLAFELHASDGVKVCNVLADDSNIPVILNDELTEVKIILSDIRLYPDRYKLILWVGSVCGRDPFDYVGDGLYIDIMDGGALTSRALPRSSGIVFLTPAWHIRGLDPKGDRSIGEHRQDDSA